LTHVTCETPTLSEADPAMEMVKDAVEYDDAVVGDEIVIEGGVTSEAVMVHVNVRMDDNRPSETLTVTR
jgi:hypothetical protein